MSNSSFIWFIRALYLASVSSYFTLSKANELDKHVSRKQILGAVDNINKNPCSIATLETEKYASAGNSLTQLSVRRYLPAKGII